MLLSGGNDEKILLWDYNTNQNGFHSSGAAAASHRTTSCPGFGFKCSIKHGSKINWIKSFSTDKNLVYVADLTNQITIYEVIG